MFDRNYRHSWPDVWDDLTLGQARVLDQVLTGRRLTGTLPNKRYAAAVADFIRGLIDESEFNRRIGRLDPATRNAGKRRRKRPAWRPLETGEL